MASKGNKRQSQKTPTCWDEIDWKRVNRSVRNLRRRIFAASKRNDYRRVRNLQKLMLRSQANILQSVRKATQLNTGKRTAGIDKQLALTKKERWALVEAIFTSGKAWKPRPAKRVYIPKRNGKKRPLGIPTITDRVLQNMHKNALEPEWEAQFEPTSYGFRPGRSSHDAMAKLFKPLMGQKAKKLWVVEADIKGCFDNIGHQQLLDRLGNYPGKDMIVKWLKAGYVEKSQFFATNSGTPQGGIVSPLLSNIALHGLEEKLGITYRWWVDKRKENGGFWQTRGNRLLVRYADDFVVLCETKEDAEAVKETLKKELSRRGLELSEEKTKITHLTEGFDFVGWNFRRYRSTNRSRGEVTIIKPSKDNIQAFKDTLKEEFKKLRGQNQATVIARLNPILRGWANYHRAVCSKETFSKLDGWIFRKLSKWGRSLHSKKSDKWILDKYFGNFCQGRKDKWVFGYEVRDNDGKGKGVCYLEKLAWTAIKRHILVTYKNSPDDSTLKEYWEKRNRTNEEFRAIQEISKGKSKIAANTDYKCRWCNEMLGSEGYANVQIHHVIPKRLGGADSYKNLIYLHSECHRQVTRYGELEASTLNRLGILAGYNEKTKTWGVEINPSKKFKTKGAYLKFMERYNKSLNLRRVE